MKENSKLIQSKPKKGITIFHGNLNVYYFGKYKGVIYAVSEYKELVSIYMENHRYLSPNEYTIEEYVSMESDILFQYENEYIEEWGDWFIPCIDINIIESSQDNIRMLVDQTKDNLKEIIFLLYEDNPGISVKFEDEYESLVTAFKSLHKFSKKKKYKEHLSKVDLIHNSILYMPMDTYTYKRSMYLEMMTRKDVWDMEENDEELMDAGKFLNDINKKE